MENKKPEYNTANPYVYGFIKDARNDLKKNPTKAEQLLWECLKSNRIGYRIRRQHVIGKYIVDFVCLAHKLIIEVDGGIHLQQKESDARRTSDLNCSGFTVIRFTNEQVYLSPELVAQKIKEVLDKTTLTSLV